RLPHRGPPARALARGGPARHGRL
ncbi:MAG: hypothetical protein AVDCRST_MAG85-974, partial [uncultured Solirubrobacteraceae bacterium]